MTTNEAAEREAKPLPEPWRGLYSRLIKLGAHILHQRYWGGSITGEDAGKQDDALAALGMESRLIADALAIAARAPQPQQAPEVQELAEECKRLAETYADGPHDDGYFGAHRAALYAAIDRLAALAQPQQAPTQPESEALTDADSVQVMGVRRDGSMEVIGTATMPPKMKARELVREQFGHIDEDAGNDAAMALWCCEQLIEWMGKNPPRVVLSQRKATKEQSE